MSNSVDREEYGLLVLIERMQQEGRPEQEIEAAVREATPERSRLVRQRPPRRPSRFDLMVRRAR